MTVDDKKAMVIETLAKHEEAIAELYSAYSDVLPNHTDFWSGLAAEETEHAKWLRNLLPKIGEGSVHFDERRFHTDAIRTSMDFIRGLAAWAQKEKPTAIKALSAALDIERGLIERGYFKVAEADSPRLKQTFEALARSTTVHIEKVQKAWFESKSASCGPKKPES